MRALALAALLLAAGAAHAAEEPRVRAEIAATGTPLVGQQIRLDVTVLAPNYFLSSPQFPSFDMPGAVVTLLDEPGINSTETIEGATYAGIRRGYAITPQRAGDFVLPPAQITFRYAAEPGQPGVAATVSLPPQRFAVQLPAGAPATASTALVARVTVTQSLDRDAKQLTAGDAITRTVEIMAANTQAMMIPPPEFAAPAGVRLYRHDPVVADVATGRGSFTGGRRVDTVTYVFEQAGTFSLPAVDIDWFNPETGRQEIASAPSIDVTVADAPAAQTEIAPPPPPPVVEQRARGAWLRLLIWSLAAVAVALAAIAIALLFGARLRARVQALRAARRASEPACFKRLARACNVDDPAAAYRALGEWARRQGCAGIRALCERQPVLRDDTIDLERHLFGASRSRVWSGSALSRTCASVRRANRTALQRTGRRPRLPELNPWSRAEAAAINPL